MGNTIDNVVRPTERLQNKQYVKSITVRSLKGLPDRDAFICKAGESKSKIGKGTDEADL